MTRKLNKVVIVRNIAGPESGEYVYDISDAIGNLDEHDDIDLIGFLADVVDYCTHLADYTPTAYGDPAESYLRGLIDGYCKAMKWEQITDGRKLTIKGRGLVILVELPPVNKEEK